MLRRWLAAANGACQECRRPTLRRCRPNTYVPRLILQKVEDTAADFNCYTDLHLKPFGLQKHRPVSTLYVFITESLISVSSNISV